VAAFLAFASLLCVILLPSKPRLWQEALGDFKLVYASASGLMQSGDAYGYGQLSRVFAEADVVRPADWYGHNPIYPFFTLFTISPLLLLSMIPAAYVWGCLSYLVAALTALRLARYAQRRYGLGLGWRLAIIALIAASPLLNFGLELGNLSLVAACLCIFAVTASPEEGLWRPAIALALALLLKPHLAFWVVLALFVSSRGPAQTRERALAWKASLLFVLPVLAMTVYLAVRHQLFPLLASYADMLHQENVGGSMDFRNHQAFLVPAQITALGMLLGYWSDSLHQIALLQLLILPLLGLALLWASLRLSPDWMLVVVSAWCSLGMVATYHRAHDGVVLFLLLPWLLARMRQRWHDGPALMVLGLYALMSTDVPRQWWRSLAAFAPMRPLANLLFDRQGATAASLLCICLIVVLLRAAHLRLAPVEPASDVEDSQVRRRS
jgi:hypothetical protein